MRSLKNPQYRIYFSTQLLSQIGCWMHSVAQNWLIFRLTGSTTFLGIMNCAEHLPIFFLNPISGILCDRVSLIKIARATQLLLSIQAFVLAYVSQSSFLTSETKGMLFALALFSGFAYAFDIPARQTLLGFIVSKEEIPNAIALNSSMYNLARIIGPSIAGLSIAAWGESICFFINGLTFLPAFVGFSFMSYENNNDLSSEFRQKWTILFREGISFIR
jgi:predicted MFS family arabinose efflux permease